MPMAESSAAYLDRVMASAASSSGAAQASHAEADKARHARVRKASRAGVGEANSAAAGAANNTPADTADQAGLGIQSDTLPAPEACRQIYQFGPLPMTLRRPPSGERKVRRDRWGGGNGEGRAAFVRWPIGLLLVASLAWVLSSAFAQQQPVKLKPAAAPAKSAPAEASKQQQGHQLPSMPVSTEQALYLIRSTLLTLNDANRSGNYTVLRDLAAPDFQARNTAADLSQSFSDLRHRNFDLYGAALLAPQLTAVPALDQRGFLHLTGYFPTRPQQIDFDLFFQDVAEQWRIYGISISTPQTPTAGR
jgi:hypothetical protein